MLRHLKFGDPGIFFHHRLELRLVSGCHTVSAPHQSLLTRKDEQEQRPQAQAPLYFQYLRCLPHFFCKMNRGLKHCHDADRDISFLSSQESLLIHTPNSFSDSLSIWKLCPRQRLCRFTVIASITSSHYNGSRF